MKRLIIIYLFTFSCCLANDLEHPEAKEAQKMVLKAFLKLPEVKKINKELKKYGISKVPINKKVLSTLGSVAVTAYKGKVDTKVIKKMNLRILSGSFRPNIVYDFKNEYFKVNCNMKWNY